VGCLSFRVRDYVASDGTTSDESRIEKDLKGSGRGLFDVLSWQLPGRTVQNYENPQSGYQVPKPSL
jgi:hypothetical protein